MRVLGDLVRFGGLFAFALGVVRCSGTSETEPGGDAGDAGEGASGGSVAGSGGSAGGGAGRGGSAGSGGSAGGGGGSAQGGSAQGGGVQGGGAGVAGAAGTPMAGRGGNGTGGGKTGGTGGDAGTPNAGTAGTPDVAGAAGEGGEAGVEGGAGGVGGSDDGGGGSPESGGQGGAPEPRLDGDVCSSALTLGATASGSTSEFTNDHQRASCLGWDLAGNDVVYSFSIPPLSRYTVVADPSDAFDLALYVVTPPAENCAAVPTCTYAADLAIEGRNETLVIDNYASEWRSYFLMVDGYGALTGNGTYDLTASSALIPSGEVCETAMPLTVGEPITATLDGFAPDYTGRPACITASASGADAVYSVNVPAGNTLTLVATPTGNMDVALYALDATTAEQCRTATACLAAADVGFGGGAETLTYTNAGAAARTIFVHVDRFDQGSAAGGYTLTSSLAPAP